MQTLGTVNGRQALPARGVYFFFEVGEARKASGAGLRVVRVGTHSLRVGSRTSLWNRLSQHRGAASSGRGNHRASIFRLLVGAALIAREGYSCATWGIQRRKLSEADRASELPLELRVSSTIAEMHCLWLPIDDAPGPSSERGLIERGSIALLSEWGKPPLDPPSQEWLGSLCNRPKVQSSGLWNNVHVQEMYSPVFLDVLERRVLATPSD